MTNIPDYARRVIDYVAKTESNNSFSAWNPNDNNRGISIGYIQFNQHVGTLNVLLKKMHAAAPELFFDTFGSLANLLLTASYVKTANLNTPEMKAAFQASAQHEVFQRCQLELAYSEYFLPAEKVAKDYGFATEAALVMFMDGAVQTGPGTIRKHVKAVCDEMNEASEQNKLKVIAERSGERRVAIYKHYFPDKPAEPKDERPLLHRKQPVNEATRYLTSELQVVLQELGLISGSSEVMTNYGVFGPDTEKAVKRFQKLHGLAEDGIVGKDTYRMLDLHDLDFPANLSSDDRPLYAHIEHLQQILSAETGDSVSQLVNACYLRALRELAIHVGD